MSLDVDPRAEVIRKLSSLADERAPLEALLDAVRPLVQVGQSTWFAIEAFVSVFDLSYSEAGHIKSWAGWSTAPDALSAEELSARLPQLVRRTPDTPRPDCGPEPAVNLTKLLASSADPLWFGVRRELQTRLSLSGITLAEAWHPADSSVGFIACTDDDEIEFTYTWPEDHPEAGRLADWRSIRGCARAREFRHALEHARRLRRERSG